MKKHPVKTIASKDHDKFNLSEFPNFSKTGSITGMRRIYGNPCFLVRCGSYIYNVTEEIYNKAY